MSFDTHSYLIDSSLFRRRQKRLITRRFAGFSITRKTTKTVLSQAKRTNRWFAFCEWRKWPCHDSYLCGGRVIGPRFPKAPIGSLKSHRTEVANWATHKTTTVTISSRSPKRMRSFEFVWTVLRGGMRWLGTNEREGRRVVGVLTWRNNDSRLGGGGEQEMDDRKQNGRPARSQAGPNRASFEFDSLTGCLWV